MKIPRIIHQIYEDPEGPAGYLTQIARSWKEYNPGWEYLFWDKNAIETFLQEYFADFIPIYRAYPYNVQRWDAIRYLILYRMGGLYVDMDYECIEPIESLLVDSSCCMGLEPKGHAVQHEKKRIVGNAFMASVPGHDYFAKIIDCMKTDWDKPFSNFIANQIMETTGPFMVTRIYENYEYKKDVKLLRAELVAPLTLDEVRMMLMGRETKAIERKIEKAYAVHYFLGSWLDQARSPDLKVGSEK